jgi:hypothetical protein
MKKAYVNNPHWLQELYIVSRNFLQEGAQPAQKAGGRTSRIFNETRQLELQRKNWRYIPGGRRLRTWYMHVRRVYEKVALCLVQRN